MNKVGLVIACVGGTGIQETDDSVIAGCVSGGNKAQVSAGGRAAH